VGSKYDNSSPIRKSASNADIGYDTTHPHPHPHPHPTRPRTVGKRSSVPDVVGFFCVVARVGRRSTSRATRSTRPTAATSPAAAATTSTTLTHVRTHDPHGSETSFHDTHAHTRTRTHTRASCISCVRTLTRDGAQIRRIDTSGARRRRRPPTTTLAAGSTTRRRTTRCARPAARPRRPDCWPSARRPPSSSPRRWPTPA